MVRVALMDRDDASSKPEDRTGASGKRPARAPAGRRASKPAGRKRPVDQPTPAEDQQPEPTDTDHPGPLPVDRERYESFLVQLTLNEDNAVIRTSVEAVKHAESEQPERWPGWDTGRLLQLIGRYATLSEPPAVVDSSPTGEPRGTRAPPATPVGEDEPVPPAARAGNGEPELRGFEVMSSASGGAQWLLQAGEPFAMRLTFDPQAAWAPDQGSLAYTATVVAKALDGDARTVLGEDHGRLDREGPAVVELRSAGLAAGLYQLQGTILLREPASGQPQHLVPLPGRVLEVY
jgi:hypothetical protein